MSYPLRARRKDELIEKIFAEYHSSYEDFVDTFDKADFIPGICVEKDCENVFSHLPKEVSGDECPNCKAACSVHSAYSLMEMKI